MLTPNQRLILESLLALSSTEPTGVDSFRFQIDHEDHLAELDDLLSEQLIEQQDDRYVLPLRTLTKLAPESAAARRLLDECAAVFIAVRSHAKAQPREKIKLTDIALLANLAEVAALRAVKLIRPMPLWGGSSVDLAGPDAYMIPADRILRYRTFEDVLEQIRRWERHNAGDAESRRLVLQRSTEGLPSHLDGFFRSSVPSSGFQGAYVHLKRLEELRSTKPAAWDLRRLVRLCEELNVAHEHGCSMATAMLVRSILDHVPPIFAMESFKELANRYAGGKSFRDSMRHLDSALRPVADSHLHVQIRKAESLPTPNQVDFRAGLDVLLAEVVRLATMG